MNAVFPVAVLCLGLGFAAGWLVKPDAATPQATSRTEAKSASPSGIVGGSNGASANPSSGEKSKPWQAKMDNDAPQPTVPAESGVDAEEAEAMVRTGQQSHLKMIGDTYRRRFEARLQKLVATLGLTDEQQARLRADSDARLAELEKLPPGAIHGGDYMEKVFASLDPSALDKDVENLLAGEQQEKFQSLKERETESRIESRAFKSMATLSRVLILEENQRSAVFAVLEEESRRAEAKAQKPSMTNFHEVFMQDMGMESTDELGLSELMMEEMQETTTIAAPGGNTPEDVEKAMKSRLRAAAEKRIEEKVNLLAPVLNAEQLSQYQAHLENTAGNMLRMMGGFQEEK